MSFALAETVVLPATAVPLVGAVIATVGAIVSIWISCDFVSSTFPTLSQARYFTVAVAGTLKGPL